jgi:galactokinase
MANASMILQRFRAHFGVEPTAITSTPGRVNLIGEHTDYNEGFVLPLAIDYRVMMAASRRDDRMVVVRSEEYAEDRTFDLTTASPVISRSWDGYVLGVLRSLSNLGDVPGMNVYIGSGVPVGSGLASSAALEIGLMRAISAIAGISWEAKQMIPLAQRVEVDVLDVRSGIMDQTVISLGRKGHAMLLDCRSLDISHVPIPDDIGIVVMDTGVRRALSASEYNERRESCESAVAAIRRTHRAVRALRDVTTAVLSSSEHVLSARERKCATHVVGENGRPAAMAAALAAGDYGRAGNLLNESHASLRDLYEVSSQHLDIICETAREHPACFGARMTGAGFGGCAIALVKGDALHDFVRVTQPRYEARTYKKSAFYPVLADDGVALLQ